MTAVSDYRIEVLEGPPDDELGERLVGFWTGQGALDEVTARDRLNKVVCVLFDAGGEVAGVNSVDAGTVPLVERRFWIYRRFVRAGVDMATEQRMLEAAIEELGRRFDGSPDQPVGVAMLLRDRTIMERFPEAVWPTGLVFAGYTGDGTQVRIRYFDGAVIA